MLSYVIFWVLAGICIVLVLFGIDYIAYPLLVIVFLMRRIAVPNEFVDKELLSEKWKVLSLIYFVSLFFIYMAFDEFKNLKFQYYFALIWIPFLYPLIRHELNRIRRIKEKG
jgi:hypothetical protein